VKEQKLLEGWQYRMEYSLEDSTHFLKTLGLHLLNGLLVMLEPSTTEEVTWKLIVSVLGDKAQTGSFWGRWGRVGFIPLLWFLRVAWKSLLFLDLKMHCPTSAFNPHMLSILGTCLCPNSPFNKNSSRTRFKPILMNSL
jgi:hypothetical protein